MGFIVLATTFRLRIRAYAAYNNNLCISPRQCEIINQNAQDSIFHFSGQIK